MGGFKGIPLYFWEYPTILGHLNVYMSIYLYVYMYNTTFCIAFPLNLAQKSKKKKKQPFSLASQIF